MTATVEQGSLETLTTNVVDEVLDSIESKLVIDDTNDTKSVDGETSEFNNVTTATDAVTSETMIATNNGSIDKVANNNGVSTDVAGLDAKQKKKYDKLAGEIFRQLFVTKTKRH